MTGGRYHVAHVSTGSRGAIPPPGSADSSLPAIPAALFRAQRERVGDYRTFAKLVAPWAEDDRRAIAAAVPTAPSTASPAITRRHDQESKRVLRPAGRDSSGWRPCCGSLEILIAARSPLLDLLARMTIAPATRLDLPQGGLPGARRAISRCSSWNAPYRIM